jgi:hypothetical protein
MSSQKSTPFDTTSRGPEKSATVSKVQELRKKTLVHKQMKLMEKAKKKGKTS